MKRRSDSRDQNQNRAGDNRDNLDKTRLEASDELDISIDDEDQRNRNVAKNLERRARKKKGQLDDSNKRR